MADLVERPRAGLPDGAVPAAPAVTAPYAQDMAGPYAAGTPAPGMLF